MEKDKLLAERLVKIVSLRTTHRMTYAAIAKIYGLSRQRIHQLIKRYKEVNKIRNKFKIMVEPKRSKSLIIRNNEKVVDEGIIRQVVTDKTTKLSDTYAKRTYQKQLQEDLNFIKKSRIIRNYK